MNHHLAHTVPCKVCEQPTCSKGTQLCDRCWELDNRIRMDPEIARRLLAEHDAKTGQPTTRPPMEIQRAHDLLVGIILGETPVTREEIKKQCSPPASVLCWVLQHDHNKAFGELLERIEQALSSMGVHLGGPI